ncbi:MAG: TRAP transporter large permease subunit [Myxococcales bacterium]|nr:TRAP transporter large permease subunit [Myxococcales bacterium]
MTDADPDRRRWVSFLVPFEDSINFGLLAAMAILPLLDMVGRYASVNVPGALQWVSVLTLWVGFSGAMLAARDGKHLSLATGAERVDRPWVRAATATAVVVAAVVTFVLAYGAYQTVVIEAEFTGAIPPGVPNWIPLVMIPVGYAIVAVRLLGFRLKNLRSRALAGAAVAAMLGALWFVPEEGAAALRWPGIAILAAATLLGAPIYVALGGAALLLFWSDAEPIAAVAAETMRQNPKSETVPTIPLFTFTGYVLAESKASERLVRAFRTLFGWLPGGMAVMTTLVCAFFTTFTGASGVTILALGGLLYPVLVAERYKESFNVGLLTSSGSIGLLFPPSLPVILYGVVAKVPIDRMFVAGLLPGLVLVMALALLGVRAGLAPEVPRHRFEPREAAAALWQAKWELALPFLVVGGIFSGLTTLVEAAAVTAAYALFVEIVIHKDLSLRDLPRVGRECATLVGGVLIILGVALGFTNYLVDADIPAVALEWVRSGISSKLVFLIALNAFLLAVGCLMDIYSAIVVVVPLILPIGEHFGVDPIHLGIIFLANLELGFMTPPVGMNLFLASYRFQKPLPQVYRHAVPFLLVLAVAVLVVTYVPALTLAPVEWMFGDEPDVPEFKF